MSTTDITFIGISAALLVAMSGGCADPSATGRTQQAVHAGTPSAVTGVGTVACTTGDGEYSSDVSGVFLTNRHFLRLGVDCAAENTRVFEGNWETEGEEALTVIEAHETSTLTARPLVIVVLAEEAAVTPVELATTSPVVGDTLTVVGYGQEAYAVDAAERPTEGSFDVTEVAADGSTFDLQPVGEARSCFLDSAAFDEGTDLVGLMASGSPDPDAQGCFSSSTAVDLVPHAAWIAEVLAMPVADPVAADGGLPDASMGDASTTPPATDDGGCSASGRAPRGGFAGMLMVAIMAVWRRRAWR